ncbi:MAG: NRDE family protein, partial [Phycisphaerales bacterium]|nr:NRDE family protein [Phycisphaerales bacterium]
MCTVSVISLRNGFRLVSNRDEQHTRPESAAPAWRAMPGPAGRDSASAQAPGPRAIWPADLRADGSEGGTWIGASDRGLALTLLNYNLTPAPALPEQPRSRGDLIPSLLHLNSAHAVAAALHEADLSAFAPFRLIAVERSTPDEAVMVAEVRWNRTTVSSAWHRAPVCFAS